MTATVQEIFDISPSKTEIANPKTLDSLPTLVMFMILDRCEARTLARLSLTSKKLSDLTKKFVEHKLSMAAQIHLYFPRSLTDNEQTMPHLQKLFLIQTLTNQKDSIGRTPLIRATNAVHVKPKETQTMKILALLGANMDEETAEGWTAEKYARYWKNQTALSCLEQMKTKAYRISLIAEFFSPISQ